MESRSVASSCGRDAREESDARGANRDDNPFLFAVLCCSGILDDCITQTDSLVMAASLDVDVLPEGCCQVNEFKMSKSGGSSIHKAHIAVQGFSQVPFVDYNTTFALADKFVMVLFVAVYSALQVTTIFMHCPPLLLPGLCRLLKSIYGLRQMSPVPIALLPPSQLHIALATPNPTRTCLQDPSITWHLTEKGEISEKIEADKVRLEVAAQRGGVLE